MLSKLVISILALVTVAAVTAGCGSSDNSGSSSTITTTSLTKAEYINEVNEICRKGKGKMVADFSAYAAQHGSPTNLVEPKLAPGILTVLVPAVRAQDEEIEELGAPKGDESEVEGFLAARRQVLVNAEENPPPTLFRFGTAFRQAPDKLAVKYGIAGCVYG